MVLVTIAFLLMLVVGWLFIKRFALCYQTVVCPVCNVGVLWSNGWMDQNETWRGDRPWSRPLCVGWEPSLPPPKKKGAQTSNFWPMSIVAKRSSISATAELLSKNLNVPCKGALLDVLFNVCNAVFRPCLWCSLCLSEPSYWLCRVFEGWWCLSHSCCFRYCQSLTLAYT